MIKNLVTLINILLFKESHFVHILSNYLQIVLYLFTQVHFSIESEQLHNT